MNILYCRKSTEDSSRQVLSIESQKTNLFEIAEREKLKIEKVFVESMSAKEPGRPEFEKMMQLIEKNPGSVIFVWKLDRLARNPSDEGRIKWLLQIKTIARIITPERTYNPEDNSLIASVEFGMATQYVKELSVNVKRGNETKLRNGGYTGRAPFGYLNDIATKSIVVDELRAPYVEKIFRMFASRGYSLKDISNRLYAEGLRTRGGKKAHASMLYRAITNQFYIGIVVRAGKHYQGSHAPLVSADLFEQAQSVLSGHRPRKQKRMFPLTGYVSCPVCPCAITASLRKGHQYYHCTDGKKLHQSGREHFRAEVLNGELAEKFKGLQFNVEMIEIMHQASLEENKQDNEFSETAVQNVLAQQKLLAQRRSRLEDTYLDGSMAKDRYEARMLALNNEEVDLANQLSKLNQSSAFSSPATIGQTKKAFLTGLYAERDYINGDDVKKRELVEILLSDAVVKDQKIQSIQFKPIFQKMFTTQKNLDFSLWSG